MHDTTLPRDLEGIHNFRPVGPYRVAGGRVLQPGKVFRSGALEPMTPADREVLERGIGLRTILDLRHPDELAQGPHPLSDRVIRLSIFREEWRQEDLIAELNGLYGPGPSPRRYLHYLEIGGDRLARAFELFAEEERYPFLVHCTAGKDRTGVLIGMIMDVLGADPADIATRASTGCWPTFARAAASWKARRRRSGRGSRRRPSGWRGSSSCCTNTTAARRRSSGSRG
jgi:protein-tyrosine phosphatase